MSETVQLGGNIELTGFNDLDKGSLIVLKKIIGNYAKRFSARTPFEKLSITLKNGGNSFELSSKLVVGGKDISSISTSSNLFFATDGCLKQIEKEFQ